MGTQNIPLYYLLDIECWWQEVFGRSSPHSETDLYLQRVQHRTFTMTSVSDVIQTFIDIKGIIDSHKPILKCLIFGYFYLHPTTCFSLHRSPSGVLQIHMSSLNYALKFIHFSFTDNIIQIFKNCKYIVWDKSWIVCCNVLRLNMLEVQI